MSTVDVRVKDFVKFHKKSPVCKFFVQYLTANWVSLIISMAIVLIFQVYVWLCILRHIIQCPEAIWELIH